jgi:hypothetical protein
MKVIILPPDSETQHRQSGSITQDVGRAGCRSIVLKQAEFIDGASPVGSVARAFGRTRFADRDIHDNPQAQETIFHSLLPACEAELFRRPYRRFKEGGVMKRVLFLACVGITLLSVTGCAKWKQKHYYRSAYVEGDACGCGVSPAVYDSAAPAPVGAVISAPGKVLPAPQF